MKYLWPHNLFWDLRKIKSECSTSNPRWQNGGKKAKQGGDWYKERVWIRERDTGGMPRVERQQELPQQPQGAALGRGQAWGAALARR